MLRNKHHVRTEDNTLQYISAKHRGDSFGALLLWTVNRILLTGRLLGCAEIQTRQSRPARVFPG